MTREELTQQSLEQILLWAKDGAEFIKEQAPDLAREIIMLGRAQSVFICAAWMSVFVSSVIVLKWSVSRLKEVDMDEMGVAGSITSSIGLAGCVIALLAGGYRLLAPWVAPKLYVLQEISRLL